MEAGARIALEAVSHAYGKGALQKQVLFDVGTEIDGGEIVILTGPSGSGKTTLLTLIGANRPPLARESASRLDIGAVLVHQAAHEATAASADLRGIQR